MTENNFPKTYDSKQWEGHVRNRWDQSNLAKPETCIEVGLTPSNAQSFSIVLPPPNVTGTLHTGHASMIAIEDTIVRFKRMNGYRTLWIPGTDHAAIATESKVEKILRERAGKTRHDLGREAFLERVRDFAEDSHDTITHQVKQMGASIDWSREAYTLDDERSLAVRTAFKRMYEAELIYRGDRIVNWDPIGQTTISDDEVIYCEEKARLYYLKYGPFEIATARPETKFGDKYVVMHPDDERYVQYTDGQKITVEWINGPIEATIIKDAVIDPGFGTGVMTITPWHSTVDFELAERRHLDREQIIDRSGKLLPVAGEFAGLPIAEAREKIIAKLQSKGLVTKIDDQYVHQIATAERTGALVEPQIMRQWFIAVNKEFDREGKKVTLKSLMQDAVRSKKITILPERFERNYFHWIDNLRDWCISRQIWFGHRIPVWYRDEEVYCDIEPPKGDGWQQDPDTLDTWFSSGLWTFSTLGWPQNTDDLKQYHPTALLETGYDILFFWVARMILMSEYLLGAIPFKAVYLHGLVRDEKGRKISKSLGNTIDPLDVSAKYGTDALRLALIVGATPGNDIRVGDEKFLAMRNFANKLWNMGRYLATAVDETKIIWKQSFNFSDVTLSPADKWILDRLTSVIHEVTYHLENYQLSLAAEILRDFTWNECADWYLEIHKIERNDSVLVMLYNELLRLWHPFMPFVTETLFASLYPNESLPLMGQLWSTENGYLPKALSSHEKALSFQEIIDLIQKIRNIRALYHIDPKEFLTLTIVARESDVSSFLPLIKRLGRTADIHVNEASEKPKGSVSIISTSFHAFVHLDNVIDITAEKSRLEKECFELEHFLAGLQTRLTNPNFISRAKPEVVTTQRETLTQVQKKLKMLRHSLEELSS